MAFNPFANSGREFFSRTTFQDQAAEDVPARILGETIRNKGFVEAQKRAAEYQARAAKAGQPSVGAQIGGAVASAAVSAGVALI